MSCGGGAKPLFALPVSSVCCPHRQGSARSSRPLQLPFPLLDQSICPPQPHPHHTAPPATAKPLHHLLPCRATRGTRPPRPLALHSTPPKDILCTLWGRVSLQDKPAGLVPMCACRALARVSPLRPCPKRRGKDTRCPPLLPLSPAGLTRHHPPTHPSTSHNTARALSPPTTTNKDCGPPQLQTPPSNHGRSPTRPCRRARPPASPPPPPRRRRRRRRRRRK